MKIFFILRTSWNNISGQQEIIFFSCMYWISERAVKIALCDLFQTELLHVIVIETSHKCISFTTQWVTCMVWKLSCKRHFWNVTLCQCGTGGSNIEQWLKYVLIDWPNCDGWNIEHWLKYVLIDRLCWFKYWAVSTLGKPWGSWTGQGSGSRLKPLPSPVHWPELNTTCLLLSESIVIG